MCSWLSGLSLTLPSFLLIVSPSILSQCPQKVNSSRFRQPFHNPTRTIRAPNHPTSFTSRVSACEQSMWHPCGSFGYSVWRDGQHVIGGCNMHLEKKLYGDAKDPPIQHTGINFEKYDDIPVKATSAGVPEPV